MRVFLTGGSGFIGSRVLRALSERGDSVAVLLRPGRRESLGGAQVVTGDLFAPDVWVNEMTSFAPDVVVNLAWDGVLGRDRNDPRQTLNVHATAELVKWSHRSGAKHFIGLGSQAEYGPANRRLSEEDRTVPTTLYGASKLAAGWLARALCEALGMRCAWLRLFSSYGPGDNPAWMIPSLIRELGARRRPKLTRCEQIWDFIYVDDVAEAVIALVSAPDAEGVFNVGSGEAHRLAEVVSKIRDLIDPNLPLGIGELPYRTDQVMHLEANIDRLRAATRWHPRTTLDEGLSLTIDWFLSKEPELLPR